MAWNGGTKAHNDTICYNNVCCHTSHHHRTQLIGASWTHSAFSPAATVCGSKLSELVLSMSMSRFGETITVMSSMGSVRLCLGSFLGGGVTIRDPPGYGSSDNING